MITGGCKEHARSKFDIQFFANFPAYDVVVRLLRFEFSARKLPHVCAWSFWRAKRHEKRERVRSVSSVDAYNLDLDSLVWRWESVLIRSICIQVIKHCQEAT